MSTSDLINVGLGQAANDKLDELKEMGIFADKIDGYRFGISLALAHGAVTSELVKRENLFNVGSLDPDQTIRQAVEALIEDDGFWAEQAHSLAIFVTPERIRTFRLPNRLSSQAEVADRFHLKPLIRSVTFPHDAYVLAKGLDCHGNCDERHWQVRWVREFVRMAKCG